jgi:hypothetical protein
MDTNVRALNILSTGKDNWQTPLEIIEYLENRLNCKFFDPCPTNPTVDGLKIDWKEYNFVNPPYSRKGEQDLWILKACQESLKGNTTVLLIPPRTDKKIFHDIILPFAYAIIFCKGRIAFLDNGIPVTANTTGSMLVIFNNYRLKGQDIIIESLDINAIQYPNKIKHVKEKMAKEILEIPD